jgi:hypothetical protein
MSVAFSSSFVHLHVVRTSAKPACSKEHMSCICHLGVYDTYIKSDSLILDSMLFIYLVNTLPPWIGIFVNNPLFSNLPNIVGSKIDELDLICVPYVTK